MFTRSRKAPSRPALIGAASLTGLALAATLAGSAYAAGGPGAGGPGTGSNGPGSGGCPVASSTATPGTPVASLSAETIAGLTFSREEERMARDLYAALAAVHDGARPMSMITTSEQRHFDEIGTLLTRYGIADPSAGREAGSYADAELQKLYDDWYARGIVSPQAAYQVGVELEQRDIADLEKLVAADAPADVKASYANLLKGSRNHLAAYERAVAGQVGGAGAQNGQGQGQNGQGQQGRGQKGQGQGQKGQGQGQTGQGQGSSGQGMGPGAMARRGAGASS